MNSFNREKIIIIEEKNNKVNLIEPHPLLKTRFTKTRVII